jgi:DivIVA domain-containing protein
MSDNAPFRTVLRGYDPAEVDARLRALSQQAGSAQATSDELTKARAQAQQLAEQVRALQTQLAERDRQQKQDADAAPVQASFTDLGARIGQMLSLAEEEAAELRDKAKAEADAHRQSVHDAVAKVQAETERLAVERRSATEAEVARLLEDAKRRADEMLDDADRDASARRAEAEAVYENQRAKAAQAAADFETTLAQRRQRAEKDFMERGSAAEAELEAVQERAATLRQELERHQRDTTTQITRELEEAREKAAEIVSAAQTRAERVRAESDRELAAAAQRRDSINAQLTNVRQMLATLSGTAPAPAQVDDAQQSDDASAGTAQGGAPADEAIVADGEEIDLTEAEAADAMEATDGTGSDEGQPVDEADADDEGATGDEGATDESDTKAAARR